MDVISRAYASISGQYLQAGIFSWHCVCGFM